MGWRFGQGMNVDRNRPHIFHRDYLPLKEIRNGLVEFIDQHLRELRGGRMLDYGCGDAPYAELFGQRGIELIRADINPTDPGVLSISAQGQVPLEDGTLDGIVSTQVLEHVPEVGPYLSEALRLLKPGGLFYCSTHGVQLLHRHPTDLWRWTIDGLRYELERAGFVVESVQPRIGMLATATHQRAIVLGGLTRRIPATGWLRPIIYLFSNIRMCIEERLTTGTVREAMQELLLITARKPHRQDHARNEASPPGPLATGR